MHILMATVEGLGIPVDEIVLNRTSLQQFRKQNRQQGSDDAKHELFEKVIVLNLANNYLDYCRFLFIFFSQLRNVRNLVVHWDGKILADLTGRKTVDRIAVLVSYEGKAIFLGAPKIQSGTGKNIADAVYSVLVEWEIAGKVVACFFDTTSTNTGQENGACYHLGNLLGRK